MEKFDIIFCVLTYKNHVDLAEFIENLNINNSINFSYKIIVVNSFADNKSLEKIKEIALNNECIFIESENKGYGFGNNLGIAYAKANYEYKYIVVCNPDILIKQFNIKELIGEEKNIIAPEIMALHGKKQNPLSYSYMPLNEKLTYIGFKKRLKLVFYTSIFINKIERNIKSFICNIQSIEKKQIYACHGSCIIFSKYAIEKLYPVFDENLFLFCEESDLAKKAEHSNVSITFNKNIIIFHKEDGSMKLSNRDLNDIHRKSYLYYYKKWNSLNK